MCALRHLPVDSVQYGMEYFDFGNGPELAQAVYEDASFGPKLDPGVMAHDWTSFYPELDGYATLKPLVPGANDATTFYETSRMMNANISIAGGTEDADYRFSYTNMDQSGILPNSSVKRNTFAFNAGYGLTDKIRISSVANYVVTDGKGRYGTGYDNRNPNQSFRQWYSTTRY